MKSQQTLLLAACIVWLASCKEQPVASFQASPDPAGVGDTVYFTNTSQYAETFHWDFNDGNSSTEEHPIHSFASTGNYDVELTASNSVGSDTWMTVVNILSPSAFCWTKLAPLLALRSSHVTVDLDGMIYVAGGVHNGNTLEAYDISKDTWKKKTEIAYWGEFAAGCALNGKIYLMGGWHENQAYDCCQEYDPATNKWEAKAPMPTHRWGHAAFPYDGKIYVLGGYDTWPATKNHSSIEVYDPVEDSWSTLSNPGGSGYTTRWGAGTCMANGLIYVIGGITETNSPAAGELFPALDVVEVYDPVSNSWSQKAPMPTPRFGLAAAEVDNKIYTIGGCSGYGEASELRKVVEVYDPVYDTWVKQEAIPQNTNFAAAVEQDRIIYVSGSVGPGLVEYDYFYSYDTSCGLK